jgi:hypothetical protein
MFYNGDVTNLVHVSFPGIAVSMSATARGAYGVA